MSADGWRNDLQRALEVAWRAVENPDDKGIAAALSSLHKFLNTKGQHLKLIGDGSVNVWIQAGFKDEEDARQHREEMETIRKLSPAEIHAKVMEFERRYAIESPEAAKDYETLLGLASRRSE